MTTVLDMIARIEALDIKELTMDSMIEGREQIVQLNRDQLFDGLNSEGDYIKPQYTRLTVQVKREKGQPSDRVTLKDTGEFYSKFYLVLQGDSFDINSSDSKTSELVMKYGKYGDIFGLTAESKRIAWTEILAPNLIQVIKQNTGLQ